MTVGKAETEVILLRRSEEKNANVPVGKLKVALALNAVHAAPGKTPSSGVSHTATGRECGADLEQRICSSLPSTSDALRHHLRPQI